MALLSSDIKLAIKNLRRNPRRTAVAVGMVSFGIIAFMLAGGFITWIFKEIREATIHSQLGHIQVVAKDYLIKGVADPYAFLIPDKSEARAIVESTPDIFVVAPRLSINGLISLNDVTLPFLGEGVSPSPEKHLSSRMEIIAGQNLEGDNDRTVILGEGLAKALDAKPGDTVVLVATTATGSSNAVELVVTGIFVTMYKDYDDIAIRFPIAIAQKLGRVSGATSWTVLLNKNESVDAALRFLRERLDTSQYDVIPWTDLADFYNKTVALFGKQVSVVKIIIGLIIILTILNTQMMSVLERTTEIGTSLAIGHRSSFVLRLFLTEGLIIGVTGGVIGVFGGISIGHLISEIGIPMPPPPGMAHGYLGQILISPGLAADAFFLAIITTLFASLFPAWKASKLNIVDALRCNQ